MKFRPFCRQTGIGSLPHIDAERAGKVILRNCPEIPHLPLLSKRSFKESSAIYCSEGMPCLIIDEEKKHFYFDTRGDITPALEKFYERYLSQDLNSFAFSAEYASGYHAMLRELASQSPSSIKIIKGQVTGPITFGLRLLDQDHKPIYYNETIRDVIIKELSMKAKWLEKKMKEVNPRVQTMIQFSEPSLQVYGSAFVSFSREEIIKSLNEVLEAVEGLTLIHCCANMDWSILTETAVDIISFDAYRFSENLNLYIKEIKSFLDKGGILGWGIVPTFGEQAWKETPGSLADLLEEKMKLFTAKGIAEDTILASAMITPSCATGSLSEALAERVYELNQGVFREMQKRYDLPPN